MHHYTLLPFLLFMQACAWQVLPPQLPPSGYLHEQLSPAKWFLCEFRVVTL